MMAVLRGLNLQGGKLACLCGLLWAQRSHFVASPDERELKLK